MLRKGKCAESESEHLQEDYDRSLTGKRTDEKDRLGAGRVKVVHGDHKLSQAGPRKFVKRLHLSRLIRLIRR
jgi:hypothetical protein